MEQLKTIGRELAMGSQAGFGQSKEFLDLVKSIGEAPSKSEEDRIIIREIENLKRRISDPDVSKSKMKEYVIRLVYVEMLGHDASFGHIHAVKMTHDDNLLFKRTGYLAVTLLLDEDHDLIILIVNTMQKDLKSDNYLVVCAALNAVSKLINEETIPAVLPQVVELLGHQKEAVRKKAIMVLHRFYQKSPGSVSHLIPNFRKRLCDGDPGVMGATLCPLSDLITVDVNSYKDLVVSFVSILKQVTERRLPKTYDYHQMPAPFIQIKLLKILALLGAGDRRASEHMYTIIGDIIRKCDSATNIGNAVLYECVCCVSCLYPNKKSLEAAAEATSKLLKSDSHNLKYMGIDALSRLVSMSSDIAEQQQLAVIDCLEDQDDTLKRKTFELLYKMTKSSNVEVIVDHMIDYMISINDNHYKTEIATRCVELAEQFAPSNQWFIQTMNRVFEHAGDLVNVKVAHNLMKLIAEGLGESDGSADSQLRSSAVESYLLIISEAKLPSMFLQVICWVLGEYGTADGKHSASYISGKLCDIAEAYSHDETIKGYAITAMMKLYAFEIAAGRKVDILPECQCFVEDLAASHSTDLQQRAYELKALMELDARTVEGVMPVDASCEDIEVDKSLSFLDNFVQESLQKGAQPYIQNERSISIGTTDYRTLDQLEASTPGLRFEAYELPKPSPYLKQKVPSDSNLSSSAELVPIPDISSSMNRSASVSSLPASGSVEVKLRLDGIQKKWGRPTYTSESSTPKSPEIPSVSNKKYGDGSSDLRKTQVEITPEKQKLAASLFGSRGSSGLEKKPPLASQRAPKTSSVQQPPPDLLDLDGLTCPTTATSNTYSSPDPLKQLEGLLNQTDNASTTMLGNANVSAEAEIMSLYSGMPFDGQTSRDSIIQGSTKVNKGPNVAESLKKDALARQVGVNPTSQNPNLFKDLLQ